MNIYWLILCIALMPTALVFTAVIVAAVSDIRIAKHTGGDPRTDRALRREAKRKVRES